MKWLCVLFVLTPMCSTQGEPTVPQNFTLTSSSPCSDPNHLFLAPGVLTIGGTNRACVSRFHTEGPAQMTLALLIEDVQYALVTRELPPGDGGCIDIDVPPKPNTKAKLIAKLWYPDPKCAWKRELSVLISAGRVVVVQVERARYRPGETLRARVIALKPDLAPAHGQVEVWLEGPRGAWEGARAAQWLHLRTRMGIAQVQHDLDELAPAGQWTIRAKMSDGSQGSSVFWVGDYELPPFQLSVRHAPKVLRTSERLVWTVCVRYPWTEAVEGVLVIRIRGAGGTVADQDARSIRTVTRIKSPRACHRHAAAARRVGLNEADPPDVLVADFNFQEEGTRIWQNTTVVSQVVDKPVNLEFLRTLHAVISPGLPYKIKVKATRWDDKPVANEAIRICRSSDEFAANLPRATNDLCHETVTDEKGIGRVTFAASDDRYNFYSFQAYLQNDTTVSAIPLHLPAWRAGSAHASLGPVKPMANSARSYVPLFVNLSNVSKPLTVHYVVINRGGNIYLWGATTQCPRTNSFDYIAETSRNSKCHYNAAKNQKIAANNQANVANNQENATKAMNDPDSLLDRHLLRVMLPIKVSHQMCPDSHILAYFYYNGEFVSASKQFEINECLNNKVEATWQSGQVAPGSLASLRLSTPGPALCALSVLNSAAKWDQTMLTVKELVMTGLKRLVDSHRNLTEYEAGTCFKTSDTQEQPMNSLEQTATWLAAAGVRIAGVAVGDSTRCSTPPAPLMEDVTVPRSDFSEAWLWQLAPVGANGTSTVSARAPDSISRFEASAVCVSRSGIAVSPPAALQVFREFFIHADAPRRLRRGDATIVRYRLFNYLYEPLSIQIQILTDTHLQGPVEVVETACVAGRASVALRAELVARAPGQARLAIRAKSVRTPGCGSMRASYKPVSDEVKILITIDPEGVPVQEYKSILLCGKGSPDSHQSEVSWEWQAAQPVPGTEMLSVWAMGDVKGPLLFDADGLVTLPRGCGEQNMARLAANLLALEQLGPDSAAAAAAKEHVSRGFTRQLKYVHPAGGFSAFGASDASPSTWLTAFSLKYLRRAHQILHPELPVPPALERAERWLLDQQMENGCFRNEGQVFHREFRGGLNEEGEIASVALTAYVITALVDSTAPLPARVVHNTLACLRALPPIKARSPARVYDHALLGYAFMKLRSYEDELRKTNEASLLWDKKEAVGAGLEVDEELRGLKELLKLAQRSQDYVWWETNSLSTSVEATAYALLALSLSPAQIAREADARGAVRWLSAHRNHAGGFLSTQDTLVALEALSKWSSVQPSTPPNLTVKLKSGSYLKQISIKPDTKVPEVTKITDKSQVDVSVEGTGCALIQATRSYNTLNASELAPDKQLTVQATVRTDGVFNCDLNRTSCFCAAMVEVCVSWTGQFPAMAVVEAALPAGFSADASRLYQQLRMPNTLLRLVELTPGGGRATLYLSARAGAAPAAGGHQCVPLHGVGPRARTRPASVRVLDYYTPTINDTVMYTIPEECPPRIAHSTSDYQHSDNLFNKARSLTDSGEILISHEYSFKDIPEGLPLDDPLYDLSRDDIAYLTEYNEVKERKSNAELKDNSRDVVKTSVNERTRKNMKNVNHRKGHSIPFFDTRRSYYNPGFEYYPTNPFIIENANSFRPDYVIYTHPNINREGIEARRRYLKQDSEPYIYTNRNYNVPPKFYERPATKTNDNFKRREFMTDTNPALVVNQKEKMEKTSMPTGYETTKEIYNAKTVEPKPPNLYVSDSNNYATKVFQADVQTDNPNVHIPSPVDSNISPNEPSENYGNSNPGHGFPQVDTATTAGDLSYNPPIFQATNSNINLNKDIERDSQLDYSSSSNLNAEMSTFNPNLYLSVPNTNEQSELINTQLDTFGSELKPRPHNDDSESTDSQTYEKSEKLTAQNDSSSSSTFNSTLSNSELYPSSYGPTLSNNSSVQSSFNTYPSNVNPYPSNFNTHPSNFNPNLSNLNTHPSNFNTSLSNFNSHPSNSNHNPSTFNPHSSNFNSKPSIFYDTNRYSSIPVHNNPIRPNISLEPHNFETKPSNTQNSHPQFNKESQKVSSQLDNPNLSDFHVIDSETDLDVPAGVEGPIPAVALPPQNFVAVAPPPGFQPPFFPGGYPRLYPFPHRPQFRYYQHFPVV